MEILAQVLATMLLVCFVAWLVMHYKLTEEKAKSLIKKYGKRENASRLLMLFGGIFLGLAVFFEIAAYLLILAVAIGLVFLAVWQLKRL